MQGLFLKQLLESLISAFFSFMLGRTAKELKDAKEEIKAREEADKAKKKLKSFDKSGIVGWFKRVRK